MARRWSRAALLRTPSHIVPPSRTKSSQLYALGSDFISQYAIEIRLLWDARLSGEWSLAQDGKAKICSKLKGSSHLTRGGLNSSPKRLWMAPTSLCALQHINERVDPLCALWAMDPRARRTSPPAIASKRIVAV